MGMCLNSQLKHLGGVIVVIMAFGWLFCSAKMYFSTCHSEANTEKPLFLRA